MTSSLSAHIRPEADTDDVPGAVASARRVLEAEAEALRALAASLDGAFDGAVAALDGITGRVVVTGMGKSGHVGRKIAATLASTGTPSFYVHPGEASHGDLGMVAADDAVIALSNSGETAELSDIIAYSRRFGIPLVAMTSRAPSSLADSADHPLVLPPMAEACPMGLAPTTSTTMMLALGDALAVALLERKGFSSADFQLYHPGGQLGRNLLRAEDLMHGGDELPLVLPTTPMSEALIEMSAKSFGCVGVVDADRRLLGVVTDGDLRRHMAGDLLDQTAGAVMTAAPRSTGPRVLAAEVLREMNASAITSVFVTGSDGEALGIVHIHDCLRAGVA